MTQQKRRGAAAFLCNCTFIAGCTDFGSEVPPAENLFLSVKAAHTHISSLDMAFDRPMRPSARGQENIILELDPYGWFTVGPLLLNPFNQSKEIDENLKSTFAHVFRDNNRDGELD